MNTASLEYKSTGPFTLGIAFIIFPGAQQQSEDTAQIWFRTDRPGSAHKTMYGKRKKIKAAGKRSLQGLVRTGDLKIQGYALQSRALPTEPEHRCAYLF